MRALFPKRFTILALAAVGLALVSPSISTTPTSLTIIQTANALPAGFFFLEHTSQVGVMDVEDSVQRVTGVVQFNRPNMRDSQLWKEQLTGSIDVIKLKNKATGQCLADVDLDEKLTIRPCSDAKTLWQKLPRGSNRLVLRRKTTTITVPIPPFSGDIYICPGARGGFVIALGCNNDTFSGELIWHATLSPVGSTSSSLGTVDPPVPPVPPVTPTGCRGSGGNCGLVSFNCDPFSASDEIIVKSGGLGVTVTGVEPQIGLIVGTYFNQGTATVTVCARRAGLSSCGSPIADVVFGPTLCVYSPSNPPLCPLGEAPCEGACKPLGQCDHRE